MKSYYGIYEIVTYNLFQNLTILQAYNKVRIYVGLPLCLYLLVSIFLLSCKSSSEIFGVYQTKYSSLVINPDSSYEYIVNRGISGSWMSKGKWERWIDNTLLLSADYPTLKLTIEDAIPITRKVDSSHTTEFVIRTEAECLINPYIKFGFRIRSLSANYSKEIELGDTLKTGFQPLSSPISLQVTAYLDPEGTTGLNEIFSNVIPIDPADLSNTFDLLISFSCEGYDNGRVRSPFRFLPFVTDTIELDRKMYQRLYEKSSQ